MSQPLFVDVFEPENIRMYLQQGMPPGLVIQTHINASGYADYMWLDVLGKRRCWERKQVSELLSDIDGVEEQLRHELVTCDELTLVVENPYMATPDGIQTFVLRRKAGGSGLFMPGRAFEKQPALGARYETWKCGVRAAGINVVETGSAEGTAWAILAAYRYSQVAEHTTMKRYVQGHEPPWSENPHIDNLCRLKGIRVGEKTAKALVEAFGTLWGVISAPKSGLVSVMGKKDAETLLRMVGRDS